MYYKHSLIIHGFKLLYRSKANYSDRFTSVAGLSTAFFRQLRNEATINNKMCELYKSAKELCNDSVGRVTYLCPVIV
jgi:hypothetical protein